MFFVCDFLGFGDDFQVFQLDVVFFGWIIVWFVGQDYVGFEWYCFSFGDLLWVFMNIKEDVNVMFGVMVKVEFGFLQVDLCQCIELGIVGVFWELGCRNCDMIFQNKCEMLFYFV